MENQENKTGFSKFAQTDNLHLAAFGFVIGITTECFTYQHILPQSI